MIGIKVREKETIESMLKRFKQVYESSNLQKELKKREYYISPSEKRHRDDIDRKKSELVANVESIFDICYYSIDRLLAANAPSEDPNTYKYIVYDLGASVAFCEVCGRMYIKIGNNQKCCGDVVCIRAINRKRQARHRQKLKENK